MLMIFWVFGYLIRFIFYCGIDLVLGGFLCFKILFLFCNFYFVCICLYFDFFFIFFMSFKDKLIDFFGILLL